MDDNIKKTKQDLKILKWKQLIDDFNNSDLSLSEWCDLNHVGKATYYKYLRLIRNGIIDEYSSSMEIMTNKSFVPISIDEPKQDPIILSKGTIHIEFDHDSDLNTIMNIIKALLC